MMAYGDIDHVPRIYNTAIDNHLFCMAFPNLLGQLFSNSPAVERQSVW